MHNPSIGPPKGAIFHRSGTLQGGELAPVVPIAGMVLMFITSEGILLTSQNTQQRS